MPNNIPKSKAALNAGAAEFRELGHALIEQIAEFLESLPERPVTAAETPRRVRDLLDSDRALPEHGAPADLLLQNTAQLLFDHSLHNGHPLFLGYITSSASPLGMLADLLAASVNPNVGKWDLSPVASEIEAQAVRWLGELIGYGDNCGGILVSGGNMANMLGFFAARTAQAEGNIRERGLHSEPSQLTVYASRETHTWVEKAADVSGLGTDAIRWIETNAQHQVDVGALKQKISADRDKGDRPFLVIGTAGNVSTGAIDPIGELASIARTNGLWFHVDGAYGAPAAALNDAPADLKALREADSIALDPHKWLYNPIEVACTLVRDPRHLSGAFGFRPPYYAFDESEPEPGNDYYAMGLQNTRGFRALKVWLTLQNVGRSGYVDMIRSDIALAQHLYDAATDHPELEAGTRNLSLTTFRYVPPGENPGEEKLNEINTLLLANLQKSGEAFISNAIVNEKYFLRACFVNFRTTRSDVDQLVEIVVRIGRDVGA